MAPSVCWALWCVLDREAAQLSHKSLALTSDFPKFEFLVSAKDCSVPLSKRTSDFFMGKMESEYLLPRVASRINGGGKAPN